MFIKEVIISGFRSYRETNNLSGLSDGLNAVVGANGCGKTNILNAIQFVLSDEYNKLILSQRQQLINESQPRLLMAFVEIVIDNTDRRIPLDMNQITFRRQIGLKKDQYYMNGKGLTLSEIVSLLETAGFSRSNPYYIVKQGKVNEIAISSDAFRLQVMREVAGTRIYDERKSEAIKMLKDCNQRSEQIDDCIKALEDKLGNLMVEGHDLKEYLKWDKRQRLLEFTIAMKESEGIIGKVLKLEDKLGEENQKLASKRSKFQDIQKKSKDCEHKLKVISGVLQQYRKDMKDITEQINVCFEEKSKIESKVGDFEEKLKYETEKNLQMKTKLKEINKLIDKRKIELVLVSKQVQDLKDRENKLSSDLSAKKGRRIDLYSKLKRKEKFKSKEERNKWIQTELPKFDEEINNYTERIEVLKKEDSDITKEMTKLENKLKSLIDQEPRILEDMDKGKQLICKSYEGIRQIERKLIDQLDLENSLKENELKYSNEKDKLKDKLTKLSGTSAVIGRESVQNVLQILEQKATNTQYDKNRLRPIIDGYLGQVIDCFDFDAKLTKAVEVCAKSKLFHHIVTTDKVGTEILKEFNKQKMPGEVTFIALDKLRVKTVRYPDFADNARPLSTLIQFDDKYQKAMEFLFDRTLVCRNMEFASLFARSAKLDCVTPEGDFVSHKGLMSGGYIGPDSRIPLFKAWKTLAEQIKELRLKAIDCSKRRANNETVLADIQNNMDKLHTEHSEVKRKVEDLKTSKDSIRQKLVDLNQKQILTRQVIAARQTTLPSIITSKKSLTTELESDLSSQFTNQEKKELNAIIEDIERMTKQLKQLSKQQNQLQNNKSLYENDLDKHLIPRKYELEKALIDSKVAQDETVIDIGSYFTIEMDQRIDNLRKDLEEKNKKIDEMVEKEAEQKDLLDNLKKDEDLQMELITRDSKKSRQIAVKIENLQKKNEDYQKKLRTMGTIPNDSGNVYKNMTLSENYRELQLCKRELAELTNVNQKALDQLADGENKSKALINERESQKLGLTAIERLIEDLENKKYEAIQLTYRQVSHHFSNIFKKFVPEGTAYIDMIYGDTSGSAASSQTSQSSEGQTSQSSGGISANEQPAYNRIDNFIGVKIRVSFNGRMAAKELNELSGGQKSIVALTFIFAIQKCDPAPFYLFDEVDHALDPMYRTKLAEIIKELSRNSQFIITTFRPELLENANKYFGVKLRNGISHVDEITKEVAKEFVESDEGPEQTSSRKRKVHFDDPSMEASTSTSTST